MINAAVELGLFDLLETAGDTGVTAGQLAEDQGWDTECTERMLDVCVSLKLLQKLGNILTTNLAACVCLCVRKILPISPLTLLFRLQTSRKFCSHSKIPIRCLWTAFCVPLSFIFYEKR